MGRSKSVTQVKEVIPVHFRLLKHFLRFGKGFGIKAEVFKNFLFESFWKFPVIALNKGNSFEIPTVTLLYAHEFGRLRLGAGVAAGSIPIKGLPDKFDVWPVYPWIDVWWRF